MNTAQQKAKTIPAARPRIKNGCQNHRVQHHNQKIGTDVRYALRNCIYKTVFDGIFKPGLVLVKDDIKG